MIEVAADRGRWTITLNRPDKANALSLAMLEALDDVLAEAAADDSLRVLVLTGAGERVFSAGADLAEARDASSITRSPLWESVSGRIAALPCLTIAALNGTLAGGAFGMALACDLRLAVPGAKFFYPVLKNGFLPQPSDPPRMAALIGPARAKMILMAGQKIEATEALAWGLVDRLVEPDALEMTVSALTADALSATASHVAGIKGLIA